MEIFYCENKWLFLSLKYFKNHVLCHIYCYHLIYFILILCTCYFLYSPLGKLDLKMCISVNYIKTVNIIEWRIIKTFRHNTLTECNTREGYMDTPIFTKNISNPCFIPGSVSLYQSLLSCYLFTNALYRTSCMILFIAIVSYVPWGRL